MFDEDPKRWRMLAETLASLGLSLEIATSFSPSEPIVQTLLPAESSSITSPLCLVECT